MRAKQVATLEEVRRMFLDKVPTAEIIRRTGRNENELLNFRKAWGIPAYGTPGPKRGSRRER